MLFDLLSLGEFIDIPVRQLSLGQRMRADICCSLMHNPEILFLDEPTIGLDVVVKEDQEFYKTNQFSQTNNSYFNDA
ncbi:ATP-binding cassette domain-containing protein [Paenibacillus beijingensis]|uniref:ATP-binding cassette domain-containing protein n=1 Tax=Paenibacillus beijingensis TaxID=1126833 RepID=UPI0030837A5B